MQNENTFYPEGRAAIRAVDAHPGLRLSGVVVSNAAQVGLDAGELAAVGIVGGEPRIVVEHVTRIGADCATDWPMPPDSGDGVHRMVNAIPWLRPAVPGLYDDALDVVLSPATGRITHREGSA